MLRPTASGIKPNTVVIAVSNTGLRRDLPPATVSLKYSSRVR